MNKTLTILIPTYNMEKYLDKCLASLIIDDPILMSQLEVLVIIDGATDHSSEIAHDYENKYPNTFRVIDKENGNYGSCINRGLKDAAGKYIKVLDADDWFDTNNFKELLVFLQSRDEDVILSDFNIVRCDGTIQWMWNLQSPCGDVLKINNLSPLHMSMHAVMHKTQNLRDHNYHQTEGISYTDTEWFYLPFAYTEAITYFNKPVYQYLVGREGQTVESITVAKKIDQPIAIARKMMSEYSNVKVDNLHKKYLLGCIERILAFIYRCVLDEAECKYNVNILAKFDKEIRGTVFYDLVDNYRYRDLDYYYIRDWRNRGCKEHLSKYKIFYYETKRNPHRFCHNLKQFIKKQFLITN